MCISSCCLKTESLTALLECLFIVPTWSRLIQLEFPSPSFFYTIKMDLVFYHYNYTSLRMEIALKQPLDIAFGGNSFYSKYHCTIKFIKNVIFFFFTVLSSFSSIFLWRLAVIVEICIPNISSYFLKSWLQAWLKDTSQMLWNYQQYTNACFLPVALLTYITNICFCLLYETGLFCLIWTIKMIQIQTWCEGGKIMFYEMSYIQLSSSLCYNCSQTDAGCACLQFSGRSLKYWQTVLIFYFFCIIIIVDHE